MQRIWCQLRSSFEELSKLNVIHATPPSDGVPSWSSIETRLTALRFIAIITATTLVISFLYIIENVGGYIARGYDNNYNKGIVKEGEGDGK